MKTNLFANYFQKWCLMVVYVTNVVMNKRRLLIHGLYGQVRKTDTLGACTGGGNYLSGI